MNRLTRNWDLVVTSSALAMIVVSVAAPHVKRLVSTTRGLDRPLD
jgi:hypothetical protein